MTEPILDIRDLHVRFARRGLDESVAVRGFGLQLAAGECVGIVGESGAGKSQSFLAPFGLSAGSARVRGSVRFADTELVGAERAVLDRVRGTAVGFIFQNPLTSLTPHLTVAQQVCETLRLHRRYSWRDAHRRARELLERVRLRDVAQRLEQYPHELSGGMRQRVMIAIAIACDPQLLVADEPTTALDVTVQADVLELLAELKRERGMSIVLITHDLGVVAGLADRVVVMQRGEIVEANDVDALFASPRHEHTRELLAANPTLDRDAIIDDARRTLVEDAEGAQLRVRDLTVRFPLPGAWFAPPREVVAVDAMSFDVHAGEALGIVGESGSGKSTLVRAILQLVPKSAGVVSWLGQSLDTLDARELARRRKDLQIVFQDPVGSLDPRMTVREILHEPLRVHDRDSSVESRETRITRIVERVALPSDTLDRYPHEFSGGQCQRIAIARAMILEPALLVCDEAVSALDVTIQAQIIALIAMLRRESGTTVLFVSHNLAVVRSLCRRVLVMHLGRLVELGDVRQVLEAPAQAYTKALLAAVPVPDPPRQRARMQARMSLPCGARSAQSCSGEVT